LLGERVARQVVAGTVAPDIEQIGD
jgi:hypothetical protein